MSRPPDTKDLDYTAADAAVALAKQDKARQRLEKAQDAFEDARLDYEGTLRFSPRDEVRKHAKARGVANVNSYTKEALIRHLAADLIGVNE